MSRENVALIRKMVTAANRRDWDAAFEDVSPGFEWDNSRAVGPDNRGVWTAIEAKEFYESNAKLWESFRIDIDELIVAGDYAVVPHTIYLRGRDAIEVTVQTAWLVTIRAGKIERVCLYQERADALKAAGLSE